MVRQKKSLQRKGKRKQKRKLTHRKRTFLTIPDEMSKNGNRNREIKSTS